MTRSNLALNLQKGGEPAGGVRVSLQSSRGNQDTITGPAAPTDASGNAAATISTWEQPGTSVVSASDTANIKTNPAGNINWFPAKYESKFEVTCYIWALEGDYSAMKTTTVDICPNKPRFRSLIKLRPIKKTYRAGFVTAVRMNGTGTGLDGKTIHSNPGMCFNYDTCARTSSGTCAVAGTTIAAHPKDMPIGTSKVEISQLGQRIAQDIGGRIDGYKIDNYMGPNSLAACSKFGRQSSHDVIFLNY